MKRFLLFLWIALTLASMPSCVANWENWYDVIPDVKDTQYIPETTKKPTDVTQVPQVPQVPDDPIPGECEHEYVSDRCKKCGDIIGTEGLIYQLNEDGQSYSLVGGLITEEKVYVATQHNGLPVTRISDHALQYNAYVKMLILPDSIETIGNGAFYECASLTTVVISKSIKTIESAAFYGCNRLHAVLFSCQSVELASVIIVEDAFPSEAEYYYYRDDGTSGGKSWRYVDGVPTLS